MADLKTISAEDFLAIAETRNLEYAYRKVLCQCDRCKGEPKPYLTTDPSSCFACGGKGWSIVYLPILKRQKMKPEDFEMLRTAIRLGEQYG